MSSILQESKTEPQAGKEPYKKRTKPCIVCGSPSVGVTNYVFKVNGRNRIGVPFCQEHLDKQEEYASPVFENQDALELYKKEHPWIYKNRIQGKIILFLQPPKNNTVEQ